MALISWEINKIISWGSTKSSYSLENGKGGSDVKGRAAVSPWTQVMTFLILGEFGLDEFPKLWLTLPNSHSLGHL